MFSTIDFDLQRQELRREVEELEARKAELAAIISVNIQKLPTDQIRSAIAARAEAKTEISLIDEAIANLKERLGAVEEAIEVARQNERVAALEAEVREFLGKIPELAQKVNEAANIYESHLKTFLQVAIKANHTATYAAALQKKEVSPAIGIDSSNSNLKGFQDIRVTRLELKDGRWKLINPRLLR